ncbi:MAG: iron-sulfur cluster-binding domain-containing protein [Christensenellaceae bacterium]|jgi:ferredoxin-NADP reductase|nr:iron-sulfur cluster-binding domain-containing protein [Christensenellaceae bacterium]
MAKTVKAKISINGYIKDLASFFALNGKRKKWIESGSTNVDMSDPVAELAKHLHPGLITSKIVKVTDETPSTKTFTLEPTDGKKLPLFYAGQYISVKYSIDGRTTTRPFAISSSPDLAVKKNQLEITLKKNPGGYVSTFVWENWVEGATVLFDGPHGHIYYNGLRDSKHVVGIAGGSGVTIFRSIANDMLNGSGRPEKMTLVYGSSNASDIIYKDEFDALAAKSNGRISVIHVLSGDVPADWSGETGFITADLIAKLIPDYKTASFYVSGPAALYDAIEVALDKLSISHPNRRIECYGESANITRNKKYPQDNAGKTYTLTVLFGVDKKEIPAISTETVAVALERAGLAVDTQCRSGECGWCRSKLEAGSVWQRPESDGVRARDKDSGYFHPCSAYPTSDITVRVFTRI